MLRKNSPPVLILESDSVWDINIRPIMALLSKQLARFLQESDSQPLYQNKNKDQPNPQHPKSLPGPNDPWNSPHWDIISLAPCYDSLKSPTPYLRYNDPFAPPLDTSNLSTPHNESQKGSRILYRSGGPICTTAYAITTRGAAKLLTRTAMNLNAPLDMIIRHMVENDELVVYGTVPTVMAQWDYVDEIGMGGAGSDIFRGEGGEAKGGFVDDADMSGWEKVMQTNSVWTVKSGQRHASFKEMALQVAWERIFSGERDVEAFWEMGDLE